MGIQPVGHRLLVRPVSQETTTKAGIILEGVEKDRPDRGVIVNIGNPIIIDQFTGNMVEKMTPTRDGGFLRVAEGSYTEFAIGDTVLFERHAPRAVRTAEGDDLLIVNASDVLAIIG